MLIEVKDFFQHADAVKLLEENGIKVIEHSDPYQAMCRCEIDVAIENTMDETYGTLSDEKRDILANELRGSSKFNDCLDEISETAESIVSDIE